MSGLTSDLAARFMATTLGHLGREYPHKLDHVMDGPADALTPSQLHPIFHGSFDWHSCVHGWWQVLRLARLHPDLPEAVEVRARAAAMLSADNFDRETAYLARPSSRGFERPYGWAWALALHGEMVLHVAPWARNADGFARAFAARFATFLPLQTYPIRTGTHFNSAFALTLALDWARGHDSALATLIEQRAVHWFGADRAAQVWEPGGDEFLSSTLCEALLMSRTLGAQFPDWFGNFLPDLAKGEPATLFSPATVSDRSDGKIAHLDGLNLSRAWCLREIVAALGDDHPLTARLLANAELHLAAALPHIAGDFMGEHWLATFALLALEAGPLPGCASGPP
ncbi:DUF2891 domain-containing protein [Aquisediminimonas profunda]|uniref:DUF2891 domain-containing protein n=1 Tax=Aquisediminimonas profunda TaxID=1550733 RepID=UPI001C62BF7A|nr:DUF2891 domain-containing protein [Aquisediminimonas profunda]